MSYSLICLFPHTSTACTFAGITFVAFAKRHGECLSEDPFNSNGQNVSRDARREIVLEKERSGLRGQVDQRERPESIIFSSKLLLLLQHSQATIILRPVLLVRFPFTLRASSLCFS